MNTFEQALSVTTYTEILVGGSTIAFDCVEDAGVQFILNETATAPTLGDTSNDVHTWPSAWDFEMDGLDAGTQRIWAIGDNTIRGVRG